MRSQICWTPMIGKNRVRLRLGMFSAVRVAGTGLSDISIDMNAPKVGSQTYQLFSYILPPARRRSSADIWLHNICRFSSTHWLPGEESSARVIQ